MSISERQAKIPSRLRSYSIVGVVAVMVLLYFDAFGIRSVFKWAFYVLVLLGVLVGAYFVYLRTRDDTRDE